MIGSSRVGGVWAWIEAAQLLGVVSLILRFCVKLAAESLHGR